MSGAAGGLCSETRRKEKRVNFVVYIILYVCRLQKQQQQQQSLFQSKVYISGRNKLQYSVYSIIMVDRFLEKQVWHAQKYI